ncbi:zinc ribbon domain-containing protein [Clostridium saccharoperbutylacetonicum]
MEKFCSNCGNTINENDKFCSKCGKQISEVSVVNSNRIVVQRKRKNGCLIAILIFILVPILLATIGIIKSKNLAKPANTTTKVEDVKEPEIKTISPGDTINSKSYDITIKKIEFTYDVLPEKKTTIYSHYAAEKGKVYIDIAANVKNTQKQNLKCDQIINVEANYNNGYKYSSQAVVEDNNTGFTYANIKDIKPLETQGMRFIIQCPEEVQTSNNPLILTFNIEGEKYNYTMK